MVLLWRVKDWKDLKFKAEMLFFAFFLFGVEDESRLRSMMGTKDNGAETS